MMKTTLTLMSAALALAALSACSATPWNKDTSQGGSTQTMTGGAEGTTTNKATPQPAAPKGNAQEGKQEGKQEGSSSSGDAASGAAEGAQMPQE